MGFFSDCCSHCESNSSEEELISAHSLRVRSVMVRKTATGVRWLVTGRKGRAWMLVISCGVCSVWDHSPWDGGDYS